MVSARKRSIQEVDGEASQPPKEPSLLHRIRNMWQFANVAQFVTIFGPALKLDAVDVESLETECLKPHSLALQNIGLGFLKFLSSHRGLTLDLFDEYTRRQFAAKAPGMENPFGQEEVALNFASFDVFKKIRVLHQMIMLIMRQPEKVRERMAELKDADHDHTSWRIEPLGWDEDDRSYFLLDDNRLYRLTDAPLPEPPAPKPKKNSKKAKALARAEKRRRISEAQESPAEPADESMLVDEPKSAEAEDDGLGGAKWECIAVGLPEVQRFLSPLKRTKDPNEKVLRDRIQEHLVPILEREEERRLKKEKERERELLNLERMAHAKRSSRLAGKAERQRQEEIHHLEEQKRLAEQVAAKKEHDMQRKLEKERNARLMSRENRLREREARRQQHEDELAQLSEDSRSVGTGGSGSNAGRLSERRLQIQIEKNKQALKELDDEEDEWVFDCVCGLYGQVDDGEHSVSCERCNVWQHSKCLGIDQEKAEREDFHFICEPCRKRQEEQQRTRPVIKLKLGSAARSSSPAAIKDTIIAGSDSDGSSRRASGIVIQLSAQPVASSAAATVEETPKAPKANASSPVLPPPPEQQSSMIPIKGAAPSSAGVPPKSTTMPKPAMNGVHNPFSSPHPALSPPQQSPNKSRAYDSMYDQSSPAAANGSAPKVNGRVKISTTPILPPVPPGYAQSKPAPSPSKQQPAGKATKVPAPSLPPPSSQSSTSSATGAGAGSAASPSTALLATPQINPGHADSNYAQKSSPLPPASGGVSPTKHSPTFPPPSANGPLLSSSPTPPVFPPVAALSPSPRVQDPTPPVKPTTGGSFSSNGTH